MRMTECMPGCVFEHRGRIPESVYRPECFSSPLEEAVYSNNVTLFRSLVKEGHTVTIRLKIGQMSCLEYAAMMGYMEMLEELMTASVCSHILQQYFALDDVVERAYMISKNKGIFFDREALVEANRYVAALYTAVVYNQPKCVELMLSRLSLREPAYRHSFYTDDDGATLEPLLTASDLARILGHTECYRIIQKKQQSTVEY